MQVEVISSQPLVCDFWGGEHGNGECEASTVAQSSVKQVNYMANPPRQQNNPFSNTLIRGEGAILIFPRVIKVLRKNLMHHFKLHQLNHLLS